MRWPSPSRAAALARRPRCGMRAWAATHRSGHSSWRPAPRPPNLPMTDGKAPPASSPSIAWSDLGSSAGRRPRPLRLGGFPFCIIGRRPSLPSVLLSCGPRHIQVGRCRGRSPCRGGRSCCRAGRVCSSLPFCFSPRAGNQDRTSMCLSVARGPVRWRRRRLPFLDKAARSPEAVPSGKRPNGALASAWTASARTRARIRIRLRYELPVQKRRAVWDCARRRTDGTAPGHTLHARGGSGMAAPGEAAVW